MSKIWKITSKKYYGNNNQYAYNTTTYVYSEKKLNQELKKSTEGKVEVFELTETFDIAAHLSSLVRDNQLDSLLCVDDEKSILHSKFIELLESANTPNREYDRRYLNTLKKEWDFLKKSDEPALKKFFAKYRTYLLHYANDSVEWYQTLLSIYNFADIKPIYTSHWTYNRETGRHENVKKLVLDLTEDQKTNFAEAKKVVSAEKKAKKKLKLQK